MTGQPVLLPAPGPADAVPTDRAETRSVVAWAGTCALLSIGLKAGLLALRAFPFNADEAIVALMARHILHGRWPAFFYGQAYMGSLDATLTALGFAVFGEDVQVIRWIQVLFTPGRSPPVCSLAWRCTRSKPAAVVAGLLLAIPNVNLTLYTTVSLGGYGEALLLGQILLLLTLDLLDRSRRRYRYAVWGFLAGIGFWTFGLTLVYILPSGIALAWRDNHSTDRRGRCRLLVGVGRRRRHWG